MHLSGEEQKYREAEEAITHLIFLWCYVDQLVGHNHTVLEWEGRGRDRGVRIFYFLFSNFWAVQNDIVNHLLELRLNGH